MKNFKINLAFTLAEVLITLGIIGIVAAMTIPTLIKNTQDMEFKTTFKKTYSEINSAIVQIKQDNGGTLKNFCTQLDSSSILQAFSPYFKILSTCTNNASYQCFAEAHLMSGSSATAYSPSLTNAGTIALFTLTNGVNIAIQIHSANCSFANGNNCGWILIDTNGMKPPNRFGKDLYGVSILEDKILPFGAINAYGSGASSCNSSSTGYSCSSEYLYK